MLHPNKYWTLTSTSPRNIIINRSHVQRKKDWINNICLMSVIKFETTINTRCYIPRTLTSASRLRMIMITLRINVPIHKIRYSAEISTADLKKNELNYGSIHFFLC